MTEPTHTASEVLEGYYRWCMEVVADGLGVDRILGTGSAKVLTPSEALATMTADLLAIIGPNYDTTGLSKNGGKGYTLNMINHRLEEQRIALLQYMGVKDD